MDKEAYIVCRFKEGGTMPVTSIITDGKYANSQQPDSFAQQTAISSNSFCIRADSNSPTAQSNKKKDIAFGENIKDAVRIIKGKT